MRRREIVHVPSPLFDGVVSFLSKLQAYFVAEAKPPVLQIAGGFAVCAAESEHAGLTHYRPLRTDE